MVKDVAIIGVPHDRYGEVPRAYVVRGDPSLDQDMLNAFLNDKVVEYKHLRGGIEFTELIPKSQSGKILRRQLKEKFLNQ